MIDREMDRKAEGQMSKWAHKWRQKQKWVKKGEDKNRKWLQKERDKLEMGAAKVTNGYEKKKNLQKQKKKH